MTKKPKNIAVAIEVVVQPRDINLSAILVHIDEGCKWESIHGLVTLGLPTGQRYGIVRCSMRTTFFSEDSTGCEVK